MAVNPEELLIFKMRGVKPSQTKQEAEQKPAAAAPQAQAPPPAPAPVQPAAAQQAPAPAPQQQVAQPKSEAKPGFFSFGLRKKQVQKAEAPQPVAVRSEIRPTMRLQDLSEEEKKMRELEKLEQEASLYETVPEGIELNATPRREERPAVVVSTFSRMTGILFIITAVIFGYSIYQQTQFVVGYMIANGIPSFFQSWSYDYVTAFANTILVVASAVSGLLMLSGVRRSHLFCGATGALMLLFVSYEYLNSGATYLLIVSVLAFMSIASLAYARMSAVSAMEREAPSEIEVNWPRIETF